MEREFEVLAWNPDVIIAAPGRLAHHLWETQIQLSAVEVIVYDEADRMFEMGFMEDIYFITEKMPKHRQSMLFSATLPQKLTDFMISGIQDYKLVKLDHEH